MFKEAMKDYFVPPESTGWTRSSRSSPMPGGALTANTQMLRDNKLMDQYSEVIAAMGEAVKKGGFGTSVTPVSQFYFQQAFNNVMFGPWNKIAKGYGKMVLGYFGKTPVPPDAEVCKMPMEQLGLPPATEHLKGIENDPKRGVAAAKAMLEHEHLPVTDENIFIVATCEEKGVPFLKGQGTIGVRKRNAAPAETVPQASFSSAPSVCTVGLNGTLYRIVLDGTNALVNGTMYDVEVGEPGVESSPAPMVEAFPVTAAPAVRATAPVPQAQPAQAAPKAAPKPAASKPPGQPVITQLPGLVLRIEKSVGQPIKTGDTILIVESMKMDNAIVSGVSGTVTAIHVKQGDQVQAGQELATIG